MFIKRITLVKRIMPTLPCRLTRREIYLTCLVAIIILLLLNLSTSNITLWKDYKHVKTWDRLKETEEIATLKGKMPNLPVAFWYRHKTFNMKMNDTCALFPNLMKVNLVNEYWQLLETPKGRFKLLGAYLDDRTGVNTVRIITMTDQHDPIEMDTWCQLWFHDSKQPVIVPVFEYFFLWHSYWYQKPVGEFQPFLISCALPAEISYKIPSSVSIVDNYCDNATNSLRVVYEKPEKKKGFAVCSKGLNFDVDISVRLVEWIELMLLLGVEKIYMYDILSTPQTIKFYDYYTRRGILEITPLMIPQVEVNDPYLQHMYMQHDANIQTEVIPLNQCILKHMHEYEYIAVLDTDEVIMPKNGMTTWKEMIEAVQTRVKLQDRMAGSFVARNCYFFGNSTLTNVKSAFPAKVYDAIEDTLHRMDVPEYMHMTQRVFRSLNCTGPGMYVKSIHSTEAVLAVHNHYSLKVLDKKWETIDLYFEEGFMHHYRNGCPGEMASVCYVDYQKDFLYDDSILSYYPQLKRNVIKALDDLGYF